MQVEIGIRTTGQAATANKNVNKKYPTSILSLVSIVRFIHFCTVQHQRNGKAANPNVFAAFIIKDRLSRNLFSTIFLCMKIWAHYNGCLLRCVCCTDTFI